jgi:hypothetical protein
LIKIWYMKTRNKVLIFLLALSIACGPSVPIYEFYSLFYNDAAATDQTRPFTYNGDNYYGYNDYYYGNDEYYDEEENNDGYSKIDSAIYTEWVKYCDNKVSFAEVTNGFTKGNGMKFKEKLSKLGKKDAADYFDIQLKVNREITAFQDAYYNGNVDSIQSFTLVPYVKCITNLKTVKDNFLIERYLYQISKIELNNQRLKALPGLMDVHKNSLNPNSPIYAQLMNNYAGCLFKSGDKTKSFYIYAQLFKDHPLLRENIYTSIKAYSIPYTTDVLKQCKSLKEEANVHALAAIQPLIDGMSLIEKAYEKDPNHELVPFAFNREINKMEEMYFSSKKAKFNYYGDIQVKDGEGRKLLDRLNKFCDRVIQENKTDLSFWQLCASYFSFLQGNTDNARMALSKAKSINKVSAKTIANLTMLIDLGDDKIMAEEAIAQLILKFKKLRQLERMEDASILNHCGNLLSKKLNLTPQAIASEKRSFLSGCNKSNLKPLTLSEANLARKFALDLLTSYVADSMHYSLFQNERQIVYDTSTLQSLQAFEKNYLDASPNKDIDKNLLSVIQLDKDGFYKALGRKYILVREFEKAAKAFGKIGKVAADKFNELCIHKSVPDSLLALQSLPTTAIEYCTVAATAKKAAEAGDEMAAVKYATMLYDLSYYGNSWFLSKSYHSSDEPKVINNYPIGWSDSYMPRGYYDLSDIDDFINKNKLKNPEHQAVMDYISMYSAQRKLGLEHNIAFNEHWENHPSFDDEDHEKYNKWLAESNKIDSLYEHKYKLTMQNKVKQYFEKYRATQYGKRVINECATIAMYIEN